MARDPGCMGKFTMSLVLPSERLVNAEYQDEDLHAEVRQHHVFDNTQHPP